MTKHEILLSRLEPVDRARVAILGDTLSDLRASLREADRQDRLVLLVGALGYRLAWKLGQFGEVVEAACHTPGELPRAA